MLEVFFRVSFFTRVLFRRRTPTGPSHHRSRGASLASGAPLPPQVVLKNGNRIPYGLCFWAGGTEPRPLTKRLIETIGPEQTETEGSKRGQITVDG